MTTGYLVKCISKRKTADMYLEQAVALKHWHYWTYILHRILLKIDGKNGKFKRKDFIPELQKHFGEIGSIETGKLIFKSLAGPYAFTFNKETKLINQISKRFDTGQFNAIDLINLNDSLLNNSYWVCQNLAYFFNKEFSPFYKTEIILKITSKMKPEGEIPTLNTERLPLHRFSSRILRDMDSDKNRWVAEYGYDKMGHKSWVGNDINFAFIKNRTSTECELVILCDEKWVDHIEIDHVFESAG